MYRTSYLAPGSGTPKGIHPSTPVRAGKRSTGPFPYPPHPRNSRLTRRCALPDTKHDARYTRSNCRFQGDGYGQTAFIVQDPPAGVEPAVRGIDELAEERWRRSGARERRRTDTRGHQAAS